MAIRREVLGDRYVDYAVNYADTATAEFQQFITTYCWGEVWSDSRLNRHDRSLAVLAMTAALGKMAEFEAHVHGALRNGVTSDELVAILRQITVYCGVPVGVNAAKILHPILRELNADETPQG